MTTPDYVYAAITNGLEKRKPIFMKKKAKGAFSKQHIFTSDIRMYKHSHCHRYCEILSCHEVYLSVIFSPSVFKKV